MGFHKSLCPFLLSSVSEIHVQSCLFSAMPRTATGKHGNRRDKLDKVKSCVKFAHKEVGTMLETCVFLVSSRLPTRKP